MQGYQLGHIIGWSTQVVFVFNKIALASSETFIQRLYKAEDAGKISVWIKL